MSNKRIVAAVFSYYPADPRVRREAEALAAEGFAVDVVCLRNRFEKEKEQVAGVTVYRLPLRRRRAGKIRYLWEYFAFIMLAFFTLARLAIRHRYALVHIHNMPDILVLSALVPRLRGARIILDLHDPMPEVLMTKYSLARSHPVIRLMKALERLSISFADLVLTPNAAFREVFLARSCPREKIHIVMNSPQENIFAIRNGDLPRKRNDGQASFHIMFHGTIVERHGLETALTAIDQLRETVPGLVFDVFGDGDDVEQFQTQTAALGLGEMVNYHGHVSLEQIASAIAQTDVGLIPNKRTPFTELNLPTRIFEYLCMHKPVVAPRTRGILDYFDEDSLYVFEPGDAESLTHALRRVYAGLSQDDHVLNKGMAVYNTWRWHSQRKHFVAIVHGLLQSAGIQT